MYVQSVSLNECCLAVEVGWSDLHTECIFKCVLSSGRTGVKRCTIFKWMPRVRNTILLCQGESAGILSSYKHWKIRRSVRHVLWITQHVDSVYVCLFVCVCDMYSVEKKSIHMPHCYIVTRFTLYGNVNSHCNKCYCCENLQVVHNLLSHELKFGVWFAASARKVRVSCFFS
jgi:hypothetical protein